LTRRKKERSDMKVIRTLLDIRDPEVIDLLHRGSWSVPVEVTDW
jgi:hypothetical protein